MCLVWSWIRRWKHRQSHGQDFVLFGQTRLSTRQDVSVLCLVPLPLVLQRGSRQHILGVHRQLPQRQRCRENRQGGQAGVPQVPGGECWTEPQVVLLGLDCWTHMGLLEELMNDTLSLLTSFCSPKRWVMPSSAASAFTQLFSCSLCSSTFGLCDFDTFNVS